MSAAVVYDVVGVKGDLFAGKKIFFRQRLPQRQKWMALVQANGGEVLNLDRFADVIIADHARKDSPAGSISWTWVQKSVEHGRLEHMENHRAGPAVPQARAAGSNITPRVGRTSFTAEDDHILWRWVSRAMRSGDSVKGNELYKRLAAEHPRHTFQSWRDRYVKQLAFQPLPHISESESGDDAVEVGVSQPSVLKSRPILQSNFTEDDDELLMTSYDAILNLDESKTIDAWESWASRYPQHTAQQWRNRFEDHIKDKKPPSPEGLFVSQHQNSDRSEAKSSRKPSAQTGVKKSKQHVEGSPYEAEASQAAASVVVEEEMRFRKDLQAFVDAEIVKDPDLKLNLSFRPIIGGRQVSLYRLWQLVTTPKFGGYDSVVSQNSWPLIAEQLNFNRYRDGAVPEQLRTCYEEMLLAEFEDCKGLLNYINEACTESQEHRMIESQLRRESSIGGLNRLETTESNLSRLNRSSGSSDSRSRLKREVNRADTQYGILTNGSGRTHKRQRVDDWEAREPEVPSTPEDVLSAAQRFNLPIQHQTPPHVSPASVSEGDEKHIYITPSRKARPTSKTSTKEAAEAVALGHLPTDLSSSSQFSEIEQLVNEYMAKGHTSNAIVEALEATTMGTGDLDQIIQSIESGQGIPTNLQGVWTGNDDQALWSPGGPAYRRLLAKHGADRVKRRLQFKKDQREE